MMSVRRVVAGCSSIGVAAALVVLVGCGDTDDNGSGVSSAAVDHAAESLSVVLDYEAASDAHDLAGSAALLDEEFVFNEPETTNMSKEDFIEMMGPFVASEDVGVADVRYFAGGDEVVESHLVWGFGGATREAPIVEVDLFTVRNGLITSLRSLYGPPDFTRRNGLVLPTEVLDAYVEAWSSSDPATIESLYAETANRSESLYGVDLHGPEEISRSAASFHQRHPDASLSIVEPYVFGHHDRGPAPTIGAVFSLIDAAGCSVRYVVLLDSDDSGAITSERVYYDLETVQTCDWQR